MTEDKRSNIARAYDQDLSDLEAANGQARAAIGVIRAKLAAGQYAAHFHAPLKRLLATLADHPDAFMIHVRDAGGVPASRLGGFGQSVIDGRDLPVSDMQPLASALTARVRLFDNLAANHRKLSADEAELRPQITALPSV